MKLYIWNYPYHVVYGSSIVYAIAETEDEARALAVNAGVSKFGLSPTDIHPPLKLGEPSRICNLPYAEIYEWSE